MIKAKNRVWTEHVDLDDDQYYVMGGLSIEFDPELSVWTLYDDRTGHEVVISNHSSLEFAKVAGNEVINMKGTK